MLPGWENYTADLTKIELSALPQIIRGLSARVDEKNAVTNKKIVEGMKTRGIVLTDARIRKIINHIRIYDLVPGLVASSKGYYVTKEIKDIDRYIESLKGRENAIRHVRESMENYLKQLTINF